MFYLGCCDSLTSPRQGHSLGRTEEAWVGSSELQCTERVLYTEIGALLFQRVLRVVPSVVLLALRTWLELRVGERVHNVFSSTIQISLSNRDGFLFGADVPNR